MAKMLAASLVALATGAIGELAPQCSSPGAEGCDTADSSALLQTGPRRLVDANLLNEHEASEPCGPDSAKIPSEYVGCWNAGKLCCVSDLLYASMMSPDPKPSDTVYNENRTWAWFGSRDDMETGLRLRKKFSTKADADKITLGLQIAVGFNPLASDPFSFLVLEKPKGSEVHTPSWSQLFYLLTQEGLSFNYETMKTIITVYSNLKGLGKPYDVVQAFSALTNCSRQCLVPVSTEGLTIDEDCGCRHEVVQAWKVVNPWLNRTTPGNTVDCFKAFFKRFPDPCAGQLRVAFAACTDALPVFTGFGLGYNTLVSPLKYKGLLTCKVPVYQRYGGREFLLPNWPISKLNNTGTARYINLAPVSTATINSPLLVNGYC